MITIPYLNKNGNSVIGGEYYTNHIFVRGKEVQPYPEWIKEQGGKFVLGYKKDPIAGIKFQPHYIAFEDDEDAIAFKLKFR